MDESVPQEVIEQQMEDIRQSTGIRMEKETIERIQRRVANKRRRRRMRPTVVNTREFLLNRQQEQDALKPIDNVTTHQPTITQDPPIIQEEGESNQQFEERVNQRAEFERARELFHSQKEEEANKYDYLIGRCFVHPNTKRLYEVVRIYWNRRRNEYAAYRQPIDGELASEEDRYSFSVEGFNGVRELTHRYSKNAGDIGMLCSWPQSEKEMLTLQAQDPICHGVIEKIKLQVETRPEMVLYQGDNREGNVQFYQPTLANGERGAVRVRVKGTQMERTEKQYITEESEEQGDDDSPIRVSRRNLRANVNQRFRYDDPDSSDEEIEELLSRTKIPSGEFAEDYNTLGHYFKMPSKCKVHRNWVTRMESATGFTGQKPYWYVLPCRCNFLHM
jgi:hypothetical protein